MRIRDWSSDVCSSDLRACDRLADAPLARCAVRSRSRQDALVGQISVRGAGDPVSRLVARFRVRRQGHRQRPHRSQAQAAGHRAALRSEEHTSELQSLMRISYAVFCLKKKTNKTQKNNINIKNTTSKT